MKAEMIGVCACILSIVSGYTPEQSINIIELEEEPEKKNQHRYNGINDIIDMINMKFKEGLTYRQIADIYNTRPDTIYRKFKRMKEKRAGEDMYAIREAGFEYQEIAEFYCDITAQGVRYKIQKFKDKDGEKKQHGNKKYTDDEMIQGLAKYYQNNGEFPGVEETNNCDYLAAYSTYCNRFPGGVTEAKKKAKKIIKEGG